MWPLIRRRRAEYFRKGYSAGAAGANARLAGIANLHRPIDATKVCRAGCGLWPCSTYQIAAGEEWKVYP
jgi:hypothetical protein